MALPFATDDGIGARATLGLILLQADETLENEARDLLPTAGVTGCPSLVASTCRTGLHCPQT